MEKWDNWKREIWKKGGNGKKGIIEKLIRGKGKTCPNGKSGKWKSKKYKSKKEKAKCKKYEGRREKVKKDKGKKVW